MRNNLASLIPDLNRAILLLSGNFVARPFAPQTERELIEAQQSCADFPVWEGASLETIYRDPMVNHAFRAWHDKTHLALPALHRFTLAGETATCDAQCRELLRLWPRALPLARIIRAEIIGQAEHFAAFGFFPGNQAAFIEEYLTNG